MNIFIAIAPYIVFKVIVLKFQTLQKTKSGVFSPDREASLFKYKDLNEFIIIVTYKQKDCCYSKY